MRFLLNSPTFFAFLAIMGAAGMASAEGTHDNAPNRGMDEKCSNDRADFLPENPGLRPYCDGCLNNDNGTMVLNCDPGGEACDTYKETCQPLLFFVHRV
jgi:hypothetical protein